MRRALSARDVRPETRNLKPEACTPKLETRSLNPLARNPIPETQNLKSEACNHLPETRYPKPGTGYSKPESRNPKQNTRNPIPQTRFGTKLEAAVKKVVIPHKVSGFWDLGAEGARFGWFGALT